MRSVGKIRTGNQQIQVDPRGWVSTAVDYNNDGTYDAVETIYIYDLERAQRSSRQRKSEDQGQASDNRRDDRQQRSGDRPSQNPRRVGSDRGAGPEVTYQRPYGSDGPKGIARWKIGVSRIQETCKDKTSQGRSQADANRDRGRSQQRDDDNRRYGTDDRR